MDSDKLVEALWTLSVAIIIASGQSPPAAVRALEQAKEVRDR